MNILYLFIGCSSNSRCKSWI